MESLIQSIFNQYGLSGISWMLVFFLLWKKFGDDLIVRRIIEENTKSMVEFKVLLQERLPRGGK